MVMGSASSTKIIIIITNNNMLKPESAKGEKDN
jgi:hypothetical protein